MPNRRRSASRSASPSQSRSRTRLDRGQQHDEDTDEEHNEDLNENAQSIENQGDNNGDNQNNNENQSNSENVRNDNIGDGPGIQPVDIELLPMMNKLNEIGVDQLEGDESNKLNLNRVYIDVQLLRLITPNSQQKAMTYGVRRRNNNNQDVIFSRLMLCRVYSEKKYSNGSRLVYLMESKNSNQNLFNKNVELRDNGVISIGTFFRILTPLPIENKMRGDIPLIKTHYPLIVMMRPSLKKSIHISKEIGNQNSMAFVLKNMTITINRSTPIKTTCGGLLCDKQRCSDWNGTRGCGCYNVRDDISNIAFEHSVFFDTGNDFVQHNDFSSTKFSLFYLKKRLPSTITVNALTMTQEYFDIETAITNVVNLVNENGGWTVTGWYKRGLITDKSLLEVPPSNVVSTEVASGQINYHIVQLLPTNGDFMVGGTDLYSELQLKKYDTSQMY